MTSQEEVFKRCEQAVESFLARIRYGKNRDASIDYDSTRLLDGTVLSVRIIGLMEVNLGAVTDQMEEYFSNQHDPRFFVGFYDVAYINNASSIKEVRVNFRYLDAKEKQVQLPPPTTDGNFGIHILAPFFSLCIVVLGIYAVFNMGSMGQKQDL